MNWIVNRYLVLKEYNIPENFIQSERVSRNEQFKESIEETPERTSVREDVDEWDDAEMWSSSEAEN